MYADRVYLPASFTPDPARTGKFAVVHGVHSADCAQALHDKFFRRK